MWYNNIEININNSYQQVVGVVIKYVALSRKELRFQS